MVGSPDHLEESNLFYDKIKKNILNCHVLILKIIILRAKASKWRVMTGIKYKLYLTYLNFMCYPASWGCGCYKFKPVWIFARA